jgi:hypothetical protein
MRLPPPLKAQLERAAEQEGTTLTAQIERRLTQSFETIRAFGGERNYAVLRVFAEVMKRIDAATRRCWIEDPWTFDQTTSAIAYLLRGWRPQGEAVAPTLSGIFADEPDRLGVDAARFVQGAIAFSDEPHGADLLSRMRTGLGSLAMKGAADE